MTKILHIILAVALVALLAGCVDNQKQNDKQETAMNSELKAIIQTVKLCETGYNL